MYVEINLLDMAAFNQLFYQLGVPKYWGKKRNYYYYQ